MSQQHIDDLIDAYSLGALEPDEVATVEAHLATCERCRGLVANARASADMLMYATPLVEPPPSLRGRVLARVREAARTDGAAIPASSASPQPQPQPASRGSLRSALRALLGAPATGDGAEPSLALLAQLLTKPDCSIWSVAGTKDLPAASARFVGVAASHEGVLLTNGLPELPPSREYQIWLLRDGKPEPNALFRVTRAGQGRQIVRSRRPLSDFGVIAVTPEPTGGSPAPTGTILLAGQLAS